MCKLIDITGQRFGRYTVLARNGIGANGMAAWLCKCDCGKEKTVIGNTLRTGKVVSCGCYQREVAVKNGSATKRHGNTHSPTYKSWLSMKGRCLNQSDQAYALYGGRGIKVCARWVYSFENFLLDMGEKPKDFSIERIDVNGNYEPQNCTWASRLEQSRNKRNTIRVLCDGVLVSLSKASEMSGIPYRVLLDRKTRLGWNDGRLFERYTQRKISAAKPCPSSSQTTD
jgi:hypothetical protein